MTTPSAPVFSVIVPAHNLAGYLSDALASLRAQTFQDWEAWLIDDGSVDGTGDIVAEAVRQDARFHAVHQPNRGLSAARNYAMRRMRGRYVAFLDGDDIVAPWWLDVASRLLQETGCDALRFGVERWTRRPPRLEPPNPARPDWVSRDLAEIQRWGWSTFLFGAYVWRLILRREVALTTRFPEEVTIKEDSIFDFRLLPRLSSVCTCSARPYGYRMRQGSLLHSRFSVDVPLTLLRRVRPLMADLPNALETVRPVMRDTLVRFAMYAVVDWSFRPKHSERHRFVEVRDAFRAFADEGLLRFPEDIRPHWRPSIAIFLRKGWVWPMRVHGLLIRIFLKLRYLFRKREEA